MGTTAFLMTPKTDPEPAHRLLRVITDFLARWHALQREALPTIDGVFVLDDIVGFLGTADFVEFGLPYLRELFSADVAVKFFHNDAACAQSIGHYTAAGINLYNPGVQTPLAEMRRLGGGDLTILGTIPPRDVLAQGTPEDVRAAVRRLLADTPDRSRLILSCAGGLPPGVSTENLRAFLDGARGGR
jgi:uroporphyrinogen decarboxylase